MRTLVVGDVHGCADELEELLDVVGFVRSEDRLASVGDLVNRGPHSLRVLRLFRDLGGDVVLGNHDVHLLCVAAGLRSSEKDTFDDVLTASDRDDLLGWLVDRPEPLVLLRDFVVVHAGFPPAFFLPDDARDANERVRETWRSDDLLARRVGALIRDPILRFLTRARYCDSAGQVPDDEDAVDPAGFEPWFDHRPEGPLTVFGHWARLEPERAQRADLRFLDTGCVYGGHLSGWLVEEDRVVSVPARRAYAGHR